MSNYKYGWIRQKPDFRDQLFTLTAPVWTHPTCDLRPQDSPIYDQGQLGSCTGNATAGAVEFARRKEGLPDFEPSRLFAYYNGRAIEGTTSVDAGAEIRDVIKGVVKYGVCPETEWPYDISKFADAPPSTVYADAHRDHVIRYSVVHQTQVGLKTCLSLGFPVVFGFTVYDSFESDQVAKTGIVPMPSKDETVVGGHAVMAVGYDDNLQQVTVRNSWGSGWGDHGYFHMPYKYIFNPNLASDFWMIQLMSSN